MRGRTCHSSLAPLGVNAVEYAARVITKIRDIGDRLAKSGARDGLYDVPFVSAADCAADIVTAIERDGFEFYVPEAVEGGFGAQKDLVVGKTQDVDAFMDLMVTMKESSAVRRP